MSCLQGVLNFAVMFFVLGFGRDVYERTRDIYMYDIYNDVGLTQTIHSLYPHNVLWPGVVYPPLGFLSLARPKKIDF